jgi:hypothetical protein
MPEHNPGETQWLIHRPYFVKMGQLTKRQFYKRRKHAAPFYTLQMLWEVGYRRPVLVTLEDAVVIFVRITEGTSWVTGHTYLSLAQSAS